MTTKTQHTPEPWVYVPHQTENKALVQSGDGRHLAELWTLDKTVNQSANAERIVECVNACKGIKHPSEWISRARDLVRSEEELKFNVSKLTDQLNEATNAAVQWKNDYEHMKAQINELLDVLEQLLVNPERVSKAATSNWLAKRYPVSGVVKVEADWFEQVMTTITNAKGLNS